MKKTTKLMSCSALAIVMAITSVAPLQAKENESKATVLVKMTVSASGSGDKAVPQINRDEIFVKQGKERLKVTEWTPAQGANAGLDLFILIDDALDTSLGTNLDDLREFIKSQPATTNVGVGYMRNATVQIVQNFTTDHEAAAKSIRLPLANTGAYGSPYLSVIDLMKRWPEHPNRREVILVTDGIDRARSGPRWHGLNTDIDVDTASDVAMRTGTIVHTIYSPGVGRPHRNYWEATNGQLQMSKLSDVTGGESYFLGLQTPVSFKPYLEQLQKVLDNQYLLGFEANAKSKGRLQSINLSTEVNGVEFSSADAVWVPAPKK